MEVGIGTERTTFNGTVVNKTRVDIKLSLLLMIIRVFLHNMLAHLLLYTIRGLIIIYFEYLPVRYKVVNNYLRELIKLRVDASKNCS
jgi:hypothetical protein